MIDESYLEGLDPGDYHAAALRAVRSTVTDLAALAPAERAAFDLSAHRQHHSLGLSPAFRQGRSDEARSELELEPRAAGEDPAITIQAAIDSLRCASSRASDSARVPLRPVQEGARGVSRARGERRLAERAGGADAEAGKDRRARAGAWPRVSPSRAICRRTSAGIAGTLYDETVVARRAAISDRHGSPPTAPSAPRRWRRSTCPSPRASSSCAPISSARAGCCTTPRANTSSSTSRAFSCISCAAAKSSSARACRSDGRIDKRRSSRRR